MRLKLMPVKAVHFLHQPLRTIPCKSMADTLRCNKTDTDRLLRRRCDIHQSRAVAVTLTAAINSPVIFILPDTEIPVQRVPLNFLRQRLRHLIPFFPWLFFS